MIHVGDDGPGGEVRLRALPVRDEGGHRALVAAGRDNVGEAEELLAALREHLRAAPVQAAGDTLENQVEVRLEVSVNQINVQEALERLGGDRALLAELAGLFMEEGPRLLGEAAAGLGAGDAGAVQNAAHQLKGLFAQFCAAQAREAAWELELEARRADLVAARPRLEALRAQMELVLPELRLLAGRGGTA